MTFKQKKKRRKIPKPEYFREKEIEHLREKYKGKLPPLLVITRTGTRRAVGIHKKIYKKGSIVQYKNKLAKVERVSTRGVHIMPFKKGKEGFSFPSKKSKTIFISTKEIERGKIYPSIQVIPV